MTQTWFTPEEFCKQFVANQKLVEAIVRTGSEPLTFRSYIVRVGRRYQYAEECRQADKESCLPELDYPLVDKKNDLVFEVARAGHRLLRSELCEVYEARGNRSLEQLEDAYITNGYGYFCSSAGIITMRIGKILFDKELLDESDAEILRDRRIEII